MGRKIRINNNTEEETRGRGEGALGEGGIHRNTWTNRRTGAKIDKIRHKACERNACVARESPNRGEVIRGKKGCEDLTNAQGCRNWGGKHQGVTSLKGRNGATWGGRGGANLMGEGKGIMHCSKGGVRVHDLKKKGSCRAGRRK